MLLFIDADVVAQHDLLPRVKNIFSGDPTLAAVFGSYDANPFEPDYLSQYRNLLHHYVHQMSKENASTFWCGCGAVRREVFEVTGGFDSGRYRQPSIEDVEFGRRLRRNGLKIRLDKSLQVKHLKRWNVRSVLRTDFIHRALPWTELILEDGWIDNDLNTSVSNRVSVITVFVLVISVATVPLRPEALVSCVLSVAVLIGLNWRFYAFLVSKRGPFFALRTLPWHWCQFLSSGIAFAVGFFRHVFRKVTIRHVC